MSDIIEVKKKPWYKRAWSRTKKIAGIVWDFISKNFWLIMGVLWGIIIWLCGWIVGFLDGHEAGMKEGFQKGKVRGHFDGSEDVIDALNKSGYNVYSGCGKDAGEWKITKMVETPIAEITAEVVEEKDF